METTAAIESLTLKVDVMAGTVKWIKDHMTEKLPDKTPFNQFCKDHHITRPTGYAWADRGIIQIEKIGGRLFVIRSSVAPNASKYQRSVDH
ncbi:MAG: hypothetical protein WKF87_17870 [Chryseolinea sp.]